MRWKNMIEFSYPWMFVLLIAPVLVRLLARAHREERTAIKVPFFNRLVQITGEEPRKGAVIPSRILAQRIFLGLSWLLMVTALSSPQWVGKPVVQNKSARDLMIAVDLSGSMETEDFQSADGSIHSRLDGVKSVLRQFVKHREGDRLGLILFGSAPYLQVPFTADFDVFLELLDESAIGMAGPRTNFGDAIGLSIKLFQNSKVEDRVLIVLTDGNDTGSKVPPIEAAKIAKTFHIKIHTIAVGKADADDQVALDVETLQTLARITGGQFFQAENQRDLANAHDEIAKLEPQKYQTIAYSPKSPLFHYALGIMFFLYAILHSILNINFLLRSKTKAGATSGRTIDGGQSNG
jgi:Ca-activated chloride channel family protein